MWSLRRISRIGLLGALAVVTGQNVRGDEPVEPTPSLDCTTVTLKAVDVPLAEVLQTVEKQTGNRIVDRRQGDGDAPLLRQLVKINFDKEPFWLAVDKLMDAAKLSVDTADGEGRLALVERPKGGQKRVGSAAYGGPFRLDVIEVQSQQNRRTPEEKSLKLQLEVAWEPRLKLIAISQRALEVLATADDTKILQGQYPDATFSSEIPQGAIVAELVFPFELPPRSVKKITTLQGKLRAIMPLKQHKFEFEKLSQAAGKTQKLDDVEVVIDKVVKNGEVWEIHMRLRLDDSAGVLEFYRGWVFENPSYLIDTKGEKHENAGFETTSESEDEIGVAYLFDAALGLEGMKWVYETPASIVEVPIDYELKDVELP